MPAAEYRQCGECGSPFTRPPGRSAAQWARMECCSTPCANARRARGRAKQAGDLDRTNGKAGYRLAWTRRKAMPMWAASWEAHRLAEDLADVAPRIIQGKGAQRISSRPSVRLFIGHVCRACGAMWVSYAAMPDTDYCKPCNKERWGGNHRQRARRYGVTFTMVRPQTIFERDGYRCQICKRKTHGTYPHARSATLDHIVPLSCGGDHTESNLQCACLGCNSRKGARAANEQLRLV